MSKKSFSHEDIRSIALLCGSIAVLIGVAVFISNHTHFVPFPGALSQSAATALGDVQGVPSGFTGQPYTMVPGAGCNDKAGYLPPNCFLPAFGYVRTPNGINIAYGPLGNQSSTATLGIFSLHPQGILQGISKLKQAYYYDPVYDGSPSPYPPTTAGCADAFATYQPLSCYDNNTGDRYDCGYYNPSNDVYSTIGTGGPGCYQQMPVAGHFGWIFSEIQPAANHGVTVAPSAPLTLEWSCLPSAGWYYSAAAPSCNWWDITCLLSSVGGNPAYAWAYPFASQSSGTLFNTGGALSGATTITAPSTPGSYTYSLTCNGPRFEGTGEYSTPTTDPNRNWTLSIPVTVTGVALSPSTAMLTATLSDGTLVTRVGHAITVVASNTPLIFTATFGKDASDTFIANSMQDQSGAAIAGPSPAATLSYNSWVPATPSATPHRFYAQSGTINYPAGANCATSPMPANCDYVDVSVSAALAPPPPTPPTDSLDAGAGPGTPVTVAVGTAVRLHAHFTTTAPDTATKTSIIDQTLTKLPDVTETPPDADKYATYTPTAADVGKTVTFYPSMQTTAYPLWNNYGAQVTITVTAAAACPAGSHKLNPPACNVCDVGYLMQAGICVPITGSITQAFKANPTSVRKGSNTSLSWGTTGMNTCTISDQATGATITDTAGTPMTGASQRNSAGTPVTVTKTTTYVLTCTDATGSPHIQSAMVTILPQYQEN